MNALSWMRMRKRFSSPINKYTNIQVLYVETGQLQACAYIPPVGEIDGDNSLALSLSLSLSHSLSFSCSQPIDDMLSLSSFSR